MVEKEFNLSEKITGEGWLDEVEVKEFIKLDFDIIKDYMTGKITWRELIIKRNKLIGKKLT